MDAKIQLCQEGRRPDLSNGSRQRGTKIRVDFYGRERQRLQSVVSGEIGQRCGRSLKGLAPWRQRTHLTLTLPLSRTDAGKFPNITAAQRDQLVADLVAAAASRERAVTGATQDNGD